MTSSPAGRRAQLTRERIESVAVDLFLRRGFDSVTVDDVARAAGVSPATFYRHFTTKEEVVVSYGGQHALALRRAAVSLGREVPPRERLPRVLVAFAGWLETQQDVLALQRDLVAGQPALVERTLVVQRQLEVELAAVLAGLAGGQEPDTGTTVAAAVGIAVLRVSVCSWQGGAATSVGEAMQRSLAELPECWGEVAD
jgi:AcrR family transcriptional regulator